jgi:hypothetical protein
MSSNAACSKCYDNNGRTTSDLQVSTLQARSTVTQCMPCYTGPNSTNTNFPLFIANSLFVNRHVNVLPGARERFDLPYSTISDAMVDAVSGDTIYVYPANGATAVPDPYIEDITLKAGVSLYAYSAPVNGRGVLDVALPRPVTVVGKLILTTATDFIEQTSYVSGFFFLGSANGESVLEARNGASMILSMSDCSMATTGAPAFIHDVNGGNVITIFNHCQFLSSDTSDQPIVTIESTSVNGTLSAELFACSVNGSFDIRQPGPARKGLSATNTQVGTAGDSTLECASLTLKDCYFRTAGSGGSPPRLLITISNQTGDYLILDTYMRGWSIIDTSVDANLLMSGNTLELVDFEMNSTAAQTANSRTRIFNSSMEVSGHIFMGQITTFSVGRLEIANSSFQTQQNGSDIVISLSDSTPEPAFITNSSFVFADGTPDLHFETGAPLSTSTRRFEFTNCSFLKRDLVGVASAIRLRAPTGSTNFVFSGCTIDVTTSASDCIDSSAGNAFNVQSGGNNSRTPSTTGLVTVIVPAGSLW